MITAIAVGNRILEIKNRLVIILGKEVIPILDLSAFKAPVRMIPRSLATSATNHDHPQLYHTTRQMQQK